MPARPTSGETSPKPRSINGGKTTTSTTLSNTAASSIWPLSVNKDERNPPRQL